MASCFFAALCLVAAVYLGFSDAALIPNRKQHSGTREVEQDNDWDFLLFVQRWPASSCVDGRVTATGHANADGIPGVDTEKCSFPAEMAPNSWIMHGIWPTKTGTVGPVNCDKNATWSIKPVDPILAELKEFWPNLETDTAVDSFWSHEWLKHGTCAQSLPALVGEFNFFNIPLTLQQKSYNFYAALESQKIVPDATKTYSHQEFATALQASYGSAIEVWCTYSKDTKMHYVAEIRICLTKTFALMDCPESVKLIKSVAGTDSCPTGTDLVYAPIKPNSPVLPLRPTRRSPLKL